MRPIHSLRLWTAAALAATSAGAQTYVKAFGDLSFSRPVWLGEFPAKPDTFLVLEQSGAAQTVYQKDGAWTKDQFVAIEADGGKDNGDEQGLLGFAFHPDFVHNGKYYVYYCLGSKDILDERTAASSRLVDSTVKPRNLLSIPDPETNHNGGTIAFGKDGYLYVGIGDGGGANDEHTPPNGQNKNALLGKFLRIDVDKAAGGKEYSIPSDNPFANGGGAPEVFAYGMRNPWKWSFDPVTGDLWAGDVGQNTVEEVDIIKKGANYGWNQVEGDRCFTGGCKVGDFTPPIYSYLRDDGNCVTGGVVFRGDQASPNYGAFVFGDHGATNVWKVTKGGTATALARPPNGIGISSFNVDRKQQIYVMGIYSAIIYRMTGTGWDASPNSIVPAKGFLRGLAGRSFDAAPGARLDASAFGDALSLEIFSLRGAPVATLSRDGREIPAGFPAGVYLLKGRAARPDLLFVK